MGRLGEVNLDDLPVTEFAFPGPLRDELVAAVLSGAKTSTSALLIGYTHDNEPLPQAGEVSAVVDSSGQRVAAIEVTSVRVVRLGDVDLQHALDEGEGFETVAQWRSGHEEFWHSEEIRAELGDPEFTVDDDTPIVAERFRLVVGLPGAEAAGGQRGSGQRVARVAPDRGEPARRPVIAGLGDLLGGAGNQVPPHHQLLAERLAPDDE
jgi:uncharacterized protein YhfF